MGLRQALSRGPRLDSEALQLSKFGLHEMRQTPIPMDYCCSVGSCLPTSLMYGVYDCIESTEMVQ